MNVIERAKRAYAPTSSPVLTGRAAELQLFSQTTARLRNATKSPDNFPQLVAALHENRRVWAHMAGEVAEDGNSLPKELRARLFYLYEFVAHHTRKVLRGEADVGPLVEINTAIMRGLKGSGAV
ncbi:flagellar biosynthesis regulator FlaF [Roseisalinus antarcticus]|uniref:Flagellar biosynthesis regulatory protein FlaF n=1 Tax=Roseisalinus antarcticus TaxID=254357 RepID=A0A1Y5TLR4_9RHOB|nr:flagellar biosynthesis regulator FlaF [Roseisalinus antarcticus]SLN63187.1 flagellar biosynthesis regulatory protein FlaF [Roseisalinus antarcticus]